MVYRTSNGLLNTIISHFGLFKISYQSHLPYIFKECSLCSPDCISNLIIDIFDD